MKASTLIFAFPLNYCDTLLYESVLFFTIPETRFPLRSPPPYYLFCSPISRFSPAAKCHRTHACNDQDDPDTLDPGHARAVKRTAIQQALIGTRFM